MTTHEMVTILMEMVGISAQTIDCMTYINGYNEQTCKDILYWATGYNDFDALLEEIENN